MTGLRALVEAVREARVPAMAGVTATALDESAMPTYLMAVEALSEFILSTPDVLAAVEAVVALGEARATKRSALNALNTTADAYYDAHDAWAQANSTLCAPADRLAARKGEE